MHKRIAAIVMDIVDIDIQKIIFQKKVDLDRLRQINNWADNLNVDGFNDIFWLNTPGPFYTSITDSCGFGLIEAPLNVAGDESWSEFVFRQPNNHLEVEQTINAAATEVYYGYYIDGNNYWTVDLILEWWNKTESRIIYLLERYSTELSRKINPGFGPQKLVPQNFKACIDFYQFGLQSYLEWYIFVLHNKKVDLPTIKCDWSKRRSVDKEFKTKFAD